MKIYICENCGKEHDGSYGSGRFCSKSCRCKAAAKKVKNRNVPRIHKRSPYGKWKCEYCDDHPIFETRRKLEEHKREFHPIPKGTSWNKGLSKETDSRIAKYVKTCKEKNSYNPWNKGKHLSIEQRNKTSVSMKKFYAEHPELVPYKLHHSSKESYPEKYFTSLFENEGIVGYERDLHVSGYFLDFAFKDKMIDFEVDGSQHYVDKAIVEHDKKRTHVLESLGWKTIRVDWRKWQALSDVERKQFVEELKTILK